MSGFWFRCFGLVALVAVDARALPEPRSVFHFSASSTLFARPGLGHDGSIYIGSGDGYVHSLAADGGFRWSYTVKGRVVAPPVEEPSSGRIFVATSEKRLYALEADSHLRWVFPLPVTPKSELTLTSKGTLLFVGQDDYLYGVTTGGALNLRLAALNARSAPALLKDGRAALVLGDSLATLKGYGYERTALPGPFGLAARLAIDASAAIFACDDGRARVQNGPLLELDQPSDCLSAPVRGDGFFAVAEVSGVRLIGAQADSRLLALGGPPLRPIWDATRHHLVLSTPSGSVTVLELVSGPP